MPKRNVDIKKLSLNSRKIADTNESENTRNFWALIRKNKIALPSHNVHECRGLLHTYMRMLLTECLSVAVSASGAVILNVSASSEEQYREMKQV
jgi:hypothetical protein